MDQEEIDKVVLAYLDKRGFKQAGLAFKQEKQQHSKGSNTSSTAQIDPDIAKLLLAFSEDFLALNNVTGLWLCYLCNLVDCVLEYISHALYEETREKGCFHCVVVDIPAQYQEGYGKLRSWAYNSLDQYQHELVRVLYPVFVHGFMDLVAKGHIQEARTFFNSFRGDHEVTHSRDLQKLEGVLCPSHLEEMEFAHSLRQSKVNLKICQVIYVPLSVHLHGQTYGCSLCDVLSFEQVKIKRGVSAGQPSSIADDAEFVTLFGSSQDAANLINQKEIHWGLLDDSLEEKLEKTGVLNIDSEKAEMREGDLEENKKRSVDGIKQGSTLKKQKKDKVISATAKVSRSENVTVSGAPRVKTELPLPVMPMEVEHSILEDLRNRVQLSSVALPSISFYTFINTHNGLNCASISHDGSLVAGGFSDSSLKGESELTPHEHMASSNTAGRSYTLFRGHAGPVHSATFSPFGDFLLSSSSDSTSNLPFNITLSIILSHFLNLISKDWLLIAVRLWSTKLNANLVCYKGHNYPVWDVQRRFAISNLALERRLQKLEVDFEAVNFYFSPFGHYFASASHDRTARIWSVDRIKPLRIMAGHLSDVDCVQWHANCNYIATGSSDRTVRLWDVQSGECVRIFVGHRSMILCLAMSPDGRYMASGDEDGTIMMWDLATGRCISPLVGHNSCIWSLSFSCEGSLLASGSADCTVKLWDVATSSKVSKTEEKTNGFKYFNIANNIFVESNAAPVDLSNEVGYHLNNPFYLDEEYDGDVPPDFDPLDRGRWMGSLGGDGAGLSGVDGGDEDVKPGGLP
ncbi:hypothetical protein DH2020_018895 [Rehmannia glutinosa]|uniref:TFIID subunit TAF5 NTD2 domain-containing protein n=1 Tax=Rehmannia glutinosa TaxID=99300 RepID=A0ABR0WK94_REHGL